MLPEWNQGGFLSGHTACHSGLCVPSWALPRTFGDLEASPDARAKQEPSAGI